MCSWQFFPGINEYMATEIQQSGVGSYLLSPTFTLQRRACLQLKLGFMSGSSALEIISFQVREFNNDVCSTRFIS